MEKGAGAPISTTVHSHCRDAPWGVSDAAVKSAVLSPIAGKTGYPAEMLELDRDLQADLGVDTESRF